MFDVSLNKSMKVGVGGIEPCNVEWEHQPKIVVAGTTYKTKRH